MLYLQPLIITTKDFQMTAKRVFILFLPIVFCFYSSFISAQDNQNADQTSHSKQSDIRPYLKPSGLIVPGALLIYGGLKPVDKRHPKTG